MAILDRVGKVFEGVFGFDSHEVTMDTVPDDVEKWDSLGHMNMVEALEKEFGVQFEVDEIMEMASVDKIVETIQNKGME